jgi:hypothetical protein
MFDAQASRHRDVVSLWQYSQSALMTRHILRRVAAIVAAKPVDVS